MSLVFNDTATYRGLVQIYEKEIGANLGDISGNIKKLKQFTADVNLALDDFIRIALEASGTWQFDDSNHTTYPIIRTNLVSGQRDYQLTTDEGGNLILDVFKVLVADSSGRFHVVNPVDVQSENDTQGFTNGANNTGAPSTYDKTANAIFLDPIPGYNATLGLEVYINREGSYFVYTDTTKTPGVPGLFHRYFAIKPAYDYARRNSLSVEGSLAAEVLKMEGNRRLGVVGTIADYFGGRSRDERKRLEPARDSNK